MVGDEDCPSESSAPPTPHDEASRFLELIVFQIPRTLSFKLLIEVNQDQFTEATDDPQQLRSLRDEAADRYEITRFPP